MRHAIIYAAALLVTGCATAPGGKSGPTAGDVAAGAFLGFMGVMVAGDPHRHVSTVYVDGERHTVTTQVRANGRKSTVRVD